MKPGRSAQESPARLAGEATVGQSDEEEGEEHAEGPHCAMGVVARYGLEMKRCRTPGEESAHCGLAEPAAHGQEEREVRGRAKRVARDLAELAADD